MVNIVPSDANLSIFGVLISLPKHPKSEYPKSSARIIITFFLSSRIDVGMTRGQARFNDAENMDSSYKSISNSKSKRKEMKGPQDISDILSGLKTKNVKVKDTSSIPLQEGKRQLHTRRRQVRRWLIQEKRGSTDVCY